MNYSNWYLIRVWKQSKFLFLCFLLFIAFQVFFSAKRIQNFPYFTYDMYSRIIEKPDVFTLYELKNQQHAVNYTSLTNLKENLLLNTLKAYEDYSNSFPEYYHDEVLKKRFKDKVSSRTYQFIHDGLITDAAFKQQFPVWINTNFKVSDDSFLIEKNTYQFSDLKMISTKTIWQNHAN